MQSVVDKQGRITIPKVLRKIFDIRPGDRVVFSAVEDGILMKKKKGQRFGNLTQKLFGAAAKGRKIRYIPIERARAEAGKHLAKKYKLGGSRE